MRLAVFRIKDDDWGVRFGTPRAVGPDTLRAESIEVTGFQSAPAAHVWILQWIMQVTGKTLSDEAMKKALKTGQDELDRILNKAAENDDDQSTQGT